jgi:ankyrin repeat protein
MIQVVEDTSSYLNCPRVETTEHIGRNHMEMCRFTGPEDVEYRKVIAAILRITTAVRPNPDVELAPKSLSLEQIQVLMNSLRFTQIDARQLTIKNADRKTCRWFLNKREYLDWLGPTNFSPHHGFLWIKGHPGTGKSTLMKFLWANAKRTAKCQTILSFFFNARGDELEQTTTGMYRSLLLQLFEQIPELKKVLETSTISPWNCSPDYQWSIELLKVLLQQAVKNLGQHQVLCFIDALDECDENQVQDMVSFFEDLGDLVVSENINFRVCLSSRHYPYITMRVGLSNTLEGQEGHNRDITDYIENELKIGNSKLAQQIRDEVQEKACSVFMWVVLVVGLLNKEHMSGRIHDLRTKLRAIPSDLHTLFRDLLLRDPENKDEMVLCIQWLLFAKRPQSPEELYFGILAGAEGFTPIPWDHDVTTAEDIDRFILNSSRGLAEATKAKSRTVQFIHESVRDFLLKEKGLNYLLDDLEVGVIGYSHDRLKMCCFHFMVDEIADQITVNRKDTKSEHATNSNAFKTKYPFLEYAAHHVLCHADSAAAEEVSQVDFLDSFEASLSQWIKINNLFQKFIIRCHKSSTRLLYILAELNLPHLIKAHPARLSYLSEGTERYLTPLLAALVCQSREAVHAFLLAKSQTLNADDPARILYENHHFKQEWTSGSFSRDFFNYKKRLYSLSYISEKGSTLLLNFLVKTERPDLNVHMESGWCLLQHAVSGDSVSNFELLCSAGAKVHEPEESCNLMTTAVRQGLFTIMERLLSAGLSLQTHEQSSLVLKAAVETGQESKVQFILDHGVHPDVGPASIYTPLERAAKDGSVGMVRLLLSRGADINRKVIFYGTTLTTAARYGHDDVVSLLITSGADVNAPADDFGSTLEAASERGHVDIVKTLLVNGADVNANGGKYGSALHAASALGRVDIVNILLANGADVNANGEKHGSALHAASSNGHIDIVYTLLANGADINANGGKYGSALQAASSNGHINTVNILLAQGSDVNARGGAYGSALAAAEIGGHPETVKLLRRHGAI